MIKSNQTLSSSRINKKLTQQQLQKKFDELYNEDKKWKTKKGQLREQRDLAKSLEDLKQCTFKPSVNPQINYGGYNPGSFIKRQMDWLNKKQKKIEEMSNQTEKKMKKMCSFHPTISKKTYSILHNPKRSQFYSSCGFQYKKAEKNGSYRQIHIRKQQVKQLQKTNSVYTFNLLTQRRNQHCQQMQNTLAQTGTKSNRSFISPQKSKKNTNEKCKKLQQEDYIQSIIIKSQQQDTFNSVSSLQLKTQRKQQNEQETEKPTIKIFESEHEEQGQQNLEHQKDQHQFIQEEEDQILQKDANEQEQQAQDQQNQTQKDQCI